MNQTLEERFSQIQEEFNIQPEKNKVVGGTLYLVATPVGNLADLSQRAVKVLSEVDFIAAEDTRNSMRLLHYLGIQKPMVSYFEHNKKSHGQLICDKLLAKSFFESLIHFEFSFHKTK